MAAIIRDKEGLCKKAMEQKPSPSCNGEVRKRRKKRKKLQTLDTELQKFQGCLKHSNSFLR